MELCANVKDLQKAMLKLQALKIQQIAEWVDILDKHRAFGDAPADFGRICADTVIYLPGHIFRSIHPTERPDFLKEQRVSANHAFIMYESFDRGH